MHNKLIAILLSVIIASGLIYVHPAFAHNFSGDESASWLAKMAEIKTEVGLVAKHIGNTDAINYYSNALGMYWNSNDTLQMGERNTLLQTEIPSTIHNTLSDAQAGNQNAVNNDVSKLDAYLDESVPVRVDSAKLNNSTIQTLAVVFVLKESLSQYGVAINSATDLNDMSKMNMSSMQGMSGMSGMKGMSGGSMAMPTPIVNQNAYENSIALATTAQSMFSTIAANNTSQSAANTKVSTAFTQLLQDMNAKADGNTVMMDIHMNIHPVLIDAYNLPLQANAGINNPQSAVPEFPLPALLIVVSIAGVVVATRFRPLGF